MNKQWKAKWIKGLLSKKYRQGRRSLRSRLTAKEDYYCCLGVICDIVNPSNWDRSELSSCYTYGNGGSYELSRYVRQKIGLTYNDMFHLIKMNDKERQDFEEIAEWIEHNL